MAAYSGAARDEAIGWFNRLQDPKLDEAGWVAFTAWLEARPEHRAAYDAVEAVWLGFDPLPSAEVVPLHLQPRAKPDRPRFIKAAAAALAVVALGAAVSGYVLTRPAPVETYRTAADEVRTLTLSDGSKVTLDRSSTIKVAFSRKGRAIELIGGEANFVVKHDAARPFTVLASAQRIEDIGTEFDVLSQPGRLRITVSEGFVAVGAAKSEQSDYHLSAGDQLERRGAEPAVLRRVEPEAASAWRNGVLIYRDTPLRDVAADLGRYLTTPVQLGPGVDEVSFSGVLRIADGEAMIGRLQAFLSLDVERGPRGVVLSRKTR
jgi:transmembrane sensor